MKDPPNPRYTIVNLFPKTNSRALSLKISLQNRNKNKGRITTNTYFASHPPPPSRFPCCVLWYLSWNKRLSRVARFSTNQQHKSLKGCLWTKKKLFRPKPQRDLWSSWDEMCSFVWEQKRTRFSQIWCPWNWDLTDRESDEIREASNLSLILSAVFSRSTLDGRGGWSQERISSGNLRHFSAITSVLQ